MIKQIAILGILILLSSQQTTVSPKTRKCECQNLQNPQDCAQKLGCIWISSTNIGSDNITTTTGSCTIQNNTTQNNSTQNTSTQSTSTQNTTPTTTNSIVTMTKCTNIENSTICSKTIGCAYFNNSCVLFSGCSAYVQTTNSLCQSISSQCTTDGTRCVDPSPCQSYNTSSLCQENIASSGAKSCKWVETGTQTSCVDKVCSDAPATYNTDLLCNQFIAGCLSTGQGCTVTRNSCTTYLQAAGCAGKIGSEGPCTINSDAGSTSCRPLTCTDAANTLSTNLECQNFLLGCLTNGKGCVKTLQSCSSYKQSQGCVGLIGSEGPCLIDSTSSTACRAQTCNDAPKSINSDNDCNAFQKGCITNGAGCVVTLKACQQYIGTTTSCLLYKGSDGNCSAPTSQTTDGPCKVKDCSAASQNTNTNSGCQQYSYKCVTNGTSCIDSPTCEATQKSTTCESNSACAYSQVCLDKSSCTNYYNQSICLLNQQQYKIGQKTYLRKCQWTSSCQNSLCSSLPTTLKSDTECETALSGCISKGNGCVDINDNCTAYSGLIQTCQKFKGLNGQQACTQLSSETNASKACVALLECSQAKLYSQVTQSSNGTCDTFLKGCFFNGLDGCTNGDCSTYLGTLTTCQNVNTATSSNKPQKCWKVNDLTNSATACVARTCSHATVTSSQRFNTDALCQAFLSNCVWNGKSTGGCQDSSTPCSSYTGTSVSCAQFSQSGQKCKSNKTTGPCKLSTSTTTSSTSSTLKKTVCGQVSVPSSLPDVQSQFQFCQGFTDYDGNNCAFGSQDGQKCRSAVPLIKNDDKSGCAQFISKGENPTQSQAYCATMKFPNSVICTFQEGGTPLCSAPKCTEILAKGENNNQKINYCKSVNYFKEGFDNIQNCFWDQTSQNCSNRDYCTNYSIPASFQDTVANKASYCSTLQQFDNIYCIYSGTGTNCSPGAQDCYQLQLNDPVPENNEIICNNSRSTTGHCQQIASCDNFNCNYNPIDPEIAVESIAGQYHCLGLKEICGFDDSRREACRQPTIPSCNKYKTYGYDENQNFQLCLYYRVNGVQCAYGGGDSCGNYSCDFISSDWSSDRCQAYHPNCYFNGEKCINSSQNCSDYIAKSIGNGELANCSNLKSKSGQLCGYSTSDKCKNRECSDISTGGSDSICSAYLPYCIFNGTGCQLPDSCENYPAFGTNQKEKSVFCNSKTPAGNGKCTYIAGANNCSLIKDKCEQYQVSDFSGTTSEIGCSLLTESSGLVCQFNSGAYCQIGDCSGAPATASSDADCKAYKPICLFDGSPCESITCASAPQNISTDSACTSYRQGCITNGAGCIESSSNCSNFKGSAETCAKFVANNGSQLCGNTNTAGATSPCSNRQCEHNITAKNDLECDTWIPPTGTIKNCVWNGSQGCVPLQQCSLFKGTIDTCPKFSATDGPCQGAGTSIAACTPYVCINAPSTYTTDAQCKQWGPGCMTNGNGCIPIGQCQKIGLPSVCKANLFGCDILNQCRTKPQQCTDLNNQIECNNIPITGFTQPGCGWNQKTNSCAPLTCNNLPQTLTTDQSCSQAISGCTTNGGGCIIKGACSSYDKQACGIASTTDIQKVCIWSNSACRPIECTDNTSAKTDIECDNYLKGCKTTGSGCTQIVTCQQFALQQFCTQDSNGNPCSWFKTQQKQQGSCLYYTKCSDIISSSHEDCQNISPHCTTNGLTCIAITSCSKTLLQASCIIGTDGNCGWLPVSSGLIGGQCALYTNCAAAKGTTNQQCKIWGKSCISDGSSCLEQQPCISYLTQQACSNQGTDGICFWQQSDSQSNQGTCRLQVCTDAVTNTNTHVGCSSYQASTQCTTTGTGCIQLSTCQSYKVEAGCVVGTDGQCFWQQSQSNTTDSQSICRLKQCTDYSLTTSLACLNSISGTKCVSNGANCIIQQLCESYTAKEACLGGGTDGQCVFIPDSTDQFKGKCQLFNSCESANQDQQTCLTRQDSCYFNSTTINGTTTTFCQPHTCSTKALASSCQPISSFDLQTYQICVLAGEQCVSGSPSQLTSTDCFLNSAQTYSWNPSTQSCRECKVSQQINNTNNDDNQTKSDSKDFILRLCLIIAIYGI